MWQSVPNLKTRKNKSDRPTHPVPFFFSCSCCGRTNNFFFWPNYQCRSWTLFVLPNPLCLGSFSFKSNSKHHKCDNTMHSQLQNLFHLNRRDPRAPTIFLTGFLFVSVLTGTCKTSQIKMLITDMHSLTIDFLTVKNSKELIFIYFLNACLV